MSQDKQAQEPSTGQMIAAPKTLKSKAVRPGNASLAALEAIRRAESALEELSVNFEDWMRSEVERLSQARRQFARDGAGAAVAEALFHAAHDLKGQASTLGYPAAAGVCASLCRLLDAFEDKTRVPADLVNHHVDAVAAMVREGARGADNATANQLVEHLRALTEEVIASAAAMPGDSVAA